MSVEAEQARGAASGSRVAASVAAVVAIVVVNAVDLADGAHHWWANFILLPGAALLVTAVPLFGGGKARTAAGYVLACAGGLTFAVAAILMTGGMGRLWPLMIILPCLAVAGTAFWLPADPIGRAAHRTVVSLAGLGAALGVTFFLLRDGVLDVGDRHWWGAFMVAAGVLAAGNGLTLLGDRRGYRLPAIVLLAGLGTAAILAGLRELLWRS